MLWSENAKNCTYKKGDILTLHGVKVAYFSNCHNLSVISGTTVFVNQNSRKVEKLRKLVTEKLSNIKKSSDSEAD